VKFLTLLSKLEIFNSPLLLKRIYENLKKKKKNLFNHPFNNYLNMWLNHGIFLCNFCFTRIITDPLPYHYYLLRETFINNLVHYTTK